MARPFESRLIARASQEALWRPQSGWHAVALRLLQSNSLALSVRPSEQHVLPLGQYLIDVGQRERRDRRALLLGCLGSERSNRGVDICAESIEIRDGARLSDCRQDRDQPRQERPLRSVMTEKAREGDPSRSESA